MQVFGLQLHRSIGRGQRFEGVVPLLALEADTPPPQEPGALNRHWLKWRRWGDVSGAGHGPLLRGAHDRAAHQRSPRQRKLTLQPQSAALFDVGERNPDYEGKAHIPHREGRGHQGDETFPLVLAEVT